MRDLVAEVLVVLCQHHQPPLCLLQALLRPQRRGTAQCGLVLGGPEILFLCLHREFCLKSATVSCGQGMDPLPISL